MTDDYEEEEGPERIPPGTLTDGATAVPIFDGYVIFPEGAAAFCKAIGAIALHVTDDGVVWAHNGRSWLDTDGGQAEATITAIGSARRQ